MIEHEGQCAGCLIGYEIPDAPEPIAADMPAMFKPLQELENIAPSDGNTGARRLYERCGYAAVATRPMVKEGWVSEGNNWVLLTKPI